MLTPFFLPTPEGDVYLAVYRPPDNVPPAGWVLHLPAFAEEMNKCRPMVNRQARLLAADGFQVVVPDLYGTGDSEGEFGGTDWQRWSRDIGHILDWIDAHGGTKVQLWGLRLGCLMALQLAGSYPDRISQLLLWQPVATGKQCVNQFLRLRMAAGLMEGTSESTAQLRGMLADGRNLEVAGYELKPALVEQLDALDAANLAPPPGLKTTWLEVAASADRPLAPVSRKIMEQWVGQGVAAESCVVTGEQFWATQEIGYSPALLETTLGIIREQSCPPARSGSAEEPAVDAAARRERPVVFRCATDELVGMLHLGAASADKAVLLVVGGPQYRVGSHRQFVHLSRALAAAGIPVLRFDYRGMGDSAGELQGFECIDEDIRAAVDVLQSELPQVRRVVIWGLCDAATATCFYARTDERVAALVLLNPWARSDAGEARTYLKHYYLQRLASADFWKDLVTGKVNLKNALTSLKDNLAKALRFSSGDREQGVGSEPLACAKEQRSVSLIERMYAGLSGFKRPVLVIISGRDLTAAEFVDAGHEHRGFRKLLAGSRIEQHRLAEADHTFSREVWRDQVANWTIDWIKGL